MRLWDWLVDWIIVGARKTPYFHIGQYMYRWWWIGADCEVRNRTNPYWDDERRRRAARRSWAYKLLTHFIAARVHMTLRSDQDSCLHDHPFRSVSIILRGGYWEWMPYEPDPARARFHNGVEAMYRVWRGPGAIVFRRASARHKLELADGKPAWSLFIMGPKTNEWGFYTPEGKVGWQDFLQRADDRLRQAEAA